MGSRKIKSRKMKLIGSRKNIFDGMDKKLLDRNVSKDAYKEHRKNRSFKNVHAIKTNFKQKTVAKHNHARQATPSHVRSQTLPHGSGINTLPRPKASSLALANSADCVDDDNDDEITDSNIKEVKKRPNKIAAKYIMTKRSKAKMTPTSPPLDSAPDSDDRHRMRVKELKQFVAKNDDAKGGANSSSRSNSMSAESATDFSTSASSEHVKSE